MKQVFTINAVARSDMGKGASRRLRREDKVPGIVYGADKEPASIAIDHNPLLQLLAKEKKLATVTIKEGIPFIPSFLFAYILLLFSTTIFPFNIGNWFL